MFRIVFLLKRGLHLIEERPLFAFWLLLGMVFLLLGLPMYLNLEPKGLHFMRQTDNLSFVLGYAQFDSPLFEPRVYNLLGTEGKAASEFPILFYLASFLSKAMGFAPWQLRIFYFLIIAAALWSWFRLNLLVSRQVFWSLISTFIPLSSVVLYFHSTAMLSDAAALGFVLIAIFQWIKGFELGEKKALIWASVFFALSGLIKVTFLIVPMSIYGAVLLFFPSNDIQGNWNKRQWLLRLLPMVLIPVVLSGLWVIYAKQYNELSGNWYFLTRATPIWQMQSQDILNTWLYMKNYWSASYFHPTLWTVWVVVFVFNVYMYRRGKGVLLRLHWILFFASLSVLLLFFRQFGDHDYYFMVFYPYFVMSFFAFVQNLRTQFPRFYESVSLKVFFLALMIAAFNHTAKKLENRFQAADNIADPVRALLGFDQVMDSLQVPEDAVVLVVGEPTHNGSLYFLKRQGYILHNNDAHQLGIARNLMPMHHYQYAVSLKNHDFGPLQEEWRMHQIYEQEGIRVFSIGK